MGNNKIKDMVDRDLSVCKKLYETFINGDLEDMEINQKTMVDLLMGLTPRYSNLISDFPKSIDLMPLFTGVEDNEDILGYKFFEYLKAVIEKLELFTQMGYENTLIPKSSSITINNTNSNSNDNNNLNNNAVNNIAENNIFQTARDKIEDMSALTDEEIEDILCKINELEEVVKSSDRKSKKWENAKEIIKWVADKSFDVAKTIIPLVLNIE